MVAWEFPLLHAGLGGIAVSSDRVVFGDRDLDNFHDVFRCLDAATGEVQWEIRRLAIGTLDYGNSSRATPLIDGDRVYLQSAFGSLICANLQNGEVAWEVNLRSRFRGPDDLPWGYCGSPLLLDDKLVVMPGGPNASVVALNASTGEVVWQTAGAAPSYGSLVAGTLGGKLQIVGHDAVSLGGWDGQTGERLWTVTPEVTGDFNVPTPLILDGQLLVTTENNGTRLFDFEPSGNIVSPPRAWNRKLAPDMSSPVIAGSRLYCVSRFLYCLDLSNGLQELWRIRDPALADYAAVFTGAGRILVVGRGELLLLNADGGRNIIARQRIFDEQVPIYSHAAIAGRHLYVRGETRLISVAL